MLGVETEGSGAVGIVLDVQTVDAPAHRIHSDPSALKRQRLESEHRTMFALLSRVSDDMVIEWRDAKSAHLLNDIDIALGNATPPVADEDG